jgi:tRNA dimethylallyltransferase
MGLLVLTGPTGTGKSDWAARAAEMLPLEIVSVDSALVYRGLDIGTAKPSAELRGRIPHHLIDICDPAETYSAGQFVCDAQACIAEVQARGRIPMLVGGTMLYLRALFRGIADLPKASPEVRQSIDQRAAKEGWGALHRELTRVDPHAAARIHPNDPQRIQRALEVYYTTGQPISALQSATRSPLTEVPRRRWALVPQDRAALHDRLASRFNAMMSEGFLSEVAALRARGDLKPQHPSMRAVGYRQLWAHLDGELSLAEAMAQGIAATRQLAKRQLTWLRSEADIEYLDPMSSQSFEKWRRELETALQQLGR